MAIDFAKLQSAAGVISALQAQIDDINKQLAPSLYLELMVGVAPASATATPAPVPAPAPAPALAESPNGTVVESDGSSAAKRIVDSHGGIWNFGVVANATNGSVIQVNGIAQAGTAAKRLKYSNHIVYQQNGSGLWWQWVNGAWVATTAPV